MPKKPFQLEDAIRAMAGCFILISFALAIWVSKYWLLFTAFVGLNVLQSAFTPWCLMEKILQQAGWKTGSGSGLGGSQSPGVAGISDR